MGFGVARATHKVEVMLPKISILPFVTCVNPMKVVILVNWQKDKLGVALLAETNRDKIMIGCASEIVYRLS